MKVIFLEHVLHVAKPGEVKEVSSGYAANFLFPKKLAKPFTKVLEKQQQGEAQKKESERRMLLGGRQDILDALEGKIFSFSLRTSGNKTFGSVSQKEVAEFIQKKFNLPLTKKHIDFGGVHSKLSELGKHHIYIDLGENFACKAIVEITPES